MNRSVVLGQQPKFDQDIVTVLTPNKLAAKALGVQHRSLLRLAKQHLSEQGLAIAPSFLSTQLLVKAASTIGLDDPEGEARALQSSLQTVLKSGVVLEALRAKGSRTDTLTSLVTEYQSLLQEKSMIDSSQLFWQAAKTDMPKEAIAIFSYAHLEADELAFINKLAGENSIVVLPYFNHPMFEVNQTAAQTLEDFGWQLDKPAPSSFSFSDLLNKDLTVKAYKFSDQEGELRQTLNQVKSLLNDGVKTSDIALVARDEQAYGPLLIDLAWEYDLPVRVLYSIPLTDTRLGAVLKLLKDVIESGLAFETTASFLSHTLIRKMPWDIWGDLRASKPKGYKAWQGHEVDLSYLKWPETATTTDYINSLESSLTQLNLEASLQKWPVEAAAFRELVKGFELLRSTATEEAISRTQFLFELQNLLASLSTPLSPARTGVVLHGPTAMFGASFEHVFLLGLNEGVFPAQVKEDPVLPFYLRKDIEGLEGIDTVAYKEKLISYLSLSAASMKLVLSFPESAQNRATLQSKVFTELEETPDTYEHEVLGSILEKRKDFRTQDDLSPYIQKQHAVEIGRESADPFNEYDGVTAIALDAESRRFSASQLTSLGQCPFKWFAAKVLALREGQELEPDVSASKLGNFYHKTLELLAGKLKTADNITNKDFLNNLETCFEEAESEEKMQSIATWPLQRNEHMLLLRQVVQSSDFYQAGAELAEQEFDFETSWFGLSVSGIIDRIDFIGDSFTLIDYKSSKYKPPGVKGEDNKANLDLQLSIYLEAAKELYPNKGLASAYYYSIKGAEKLVAYKDEEAKLEAFSGRVKEHLSEGSYPVLPDKDEKACTFCDFSSLCRIGPRIERKIAERKKSESEAA